MNYNPNYNTNYRPNYPGNNNNNNYRGRGGGPNSRGGSNSGFTGYNTNNYYNTTNNNNNNTYTPAQSNFSYPTTESSSKSTGAEGNKKRGRGEIPGGYLSKFDILNSSDITKTAEKDVANLFQRRLKMQLPEVEVVPVPKSLIKRAVMSFEFNGENLCAIGESSKAKSAKSLCYMHAARLIDYYSLDAKSRAGEEPPRPLQENMLTEANQTVQPPPNPEDFSDYDLFVEACQVYLAQNNNNELFLLQYFIIPPSTNPLVNSTAAEIQKRRESRKQAPDKGCLLRLENQIRGIGKEMLVFRVGPNARAATLTLDEKSNLKATGIASTSVDAKQFCAEHALLMLDRLKSQGSPMPIGQTLQNQGSADGNTLSDECSGGASIASVINSLNPRYSNMYTFFRFLFDVEEPELHFSKRADPNSGSDKTYFYCRFKLNDIECEGKGINRFEAERAAVETALSEMELYDERIQDLNSFLAKHPQVNVDCIPTASLSSELSKEISSFVDQVNEKLHFASKSQSNDAQGNHNTPLTQEEMNLRKMTSGEERPRNPMYADRMLHDLQQLRQNPTYLQNFHPRRSTLAMCEVKDQLLRHLDNGERVVVVCGTTGCGKTTQVPQYIFEHEIEKGNGDICNILISQPRRLTTFSVAERIAQERLTSVGKDIGYAIRFEAKIGRHLNLCTSGVLLQILSSQPYLNDVTHLIIDEVHERDVNCDVILALIKNVLANNPHIKVILMSATLQSDLFSSYFGRAPILNVEGAVYPVQEVYLEDVALRNLRNNDSVGPSIRLLNGPGTFHQVPNSFMFDTIEKQEMGMNQGNYYAQRRRQQASISEPPKTDYYLISYLIFRSICCDMKGDVQGKSILVFLPGWKELVSAKQALENTASRNSYGVLLNGQPIRFNIILLHSSVDARKQRECFEPAPPGYVKVVFATNIAESGITIDDAAVVIDTGLIKQTSWVSSSSGGSAYTGLGRLYTAQDAYQKAAGNEEETYGHFSTQLSLQYASKANCIQRKGRAGRTQGGVCYRLFTRATWESLPPYQRAEIHRVPLTQVLLKLLSIGYGKPKETLQTFLEPPSNKNVDVSMQLLKHLGAVDAQEQLTTLGRYLSKLPCDPRVGKMIMMGAILNCLDSVLTVAAAADLSPFVNARDLKVEVRKKRYFFARNTQSDQISFLNAYNSFCANMESYDFAQANYLHFTNMQLISKYKWQYRDILLQSGLIRMEELNTVAPLFQGALSENNTLSTSKLTDNDNFFSPNSNGELRNFDDVNSSFGGEDMLGGGVYTGSMCVDTSILSRDALDVSLVKACVCASLFPHIAVLDPSGAGGVGKALNKPSKKIALRTKSHLSIGPSNDSACRRVGGPGTVESGHLSKKQYMQQLINTESANAAGVTRSPPPAMFYVYQDIFTVKEARRSFLTNVSSISLWALLLFGAGEAQVQYYDTLSLCCIDHWLYIRIPKDTFTVLSKLKECLHQCMWHKYSSPHDETNNRALTQLQAYCKAVLKSALTHGNSKEEEESQMRLHRLVDSGTIIPPLPYALRQGGMLQNNESFGSNNNDGNGNWEYDMSFDDDDDDF